MGNFQAVKTEKGGNQQVLFSLLNEEEKQEKSIKRGENIRKWQNNAPETDLTLKWEMHSLFNHDHVFFGYQSP